MGLLCASSDEEYGEEGEFELDESSEGVVGKKA